MGDNSRLWNGHYQIRKEIGEGAYGHVFLARDILKEKGEANQRVAIKVLKPEVKEPDDDDNDLESKIMFELYKMQMKDKTYCQGLPKIIDSGLSINQEEFFVMERLGVSLVDVLKRNRLKFSYDQVVSLGV